MTEVPTVKNSPDIEEKDAKLRAAYSAATKRLREENLDRFNELRAEEAKRLGVEWSPRPTAEQKAEAELEALLAAHPNLAEKVADRILSTDVSPALSAVPNKSGTGVQ